MTTEYYQIPSQQGLLPLDSSSPDPWLASATSALSLSDTWSVKGRALNPPSLFDAGDADAVSWKHVVPMHNAGTIKTEVKAPKVPKQFNSTTSKIDAWSVVDINTTNSKLNKRTSKTLSQPPAVEEEKPIEDELTQQNISFSHFTFFYSSPRYVHSHITHIYDSPHRYKTELCKSFTETGACRYGTKCQFAHGKEEIRPILRHPKYKTEICKTFHTTGTCPYGIRCRFIHTRSKEESMMLTKTPTPSTSPLLEEEEDAADDDDVISLAHPPGIPVPQWSKSWNMSIASPVVQRKNARMPERLTQPEPAF